MVASTIKKPALVIFVFCLSLYLTAATALYAQGSDSKTDAGYIDLLGKNAQGKYNKHGWNHYGPGYFTLDPDTGVLSSRGGMGVFWYSARQFKDFVLELDFMCDKDNTNSGIFVRMPNMPASNDYIFECFEIQIYDAALSQKKHVMHTTDVKATDDSPLLHTTGAVYDAEPPTKMASLGSGEWNHYKITLQGLKYTIELNGQVVNEWMAEPRGKVATHWPKGYIGLQNHDDTSSVHFRNIRVKEL